MIKLTVLQLSIFALVASIDCTPNVDYEARIAELADLYYSLDYEEDEYFNKDWLISEQIRNETPELRPAFDRLMNMFVTRNNLKEQIMHRWLECMSRYSSSDSDQFGLRNSDITTFFMEVMNDIKVNKDYDSPWLEAYLKGEGFCSKLRYGDDLEYIGASTDEIFGKFGFLLHEMSDRGLYADQGPLKAFAKLTQVCQSLKQYPLAPWKQRQILAAIIRQPNRDDHSKPWKPLALLDDDVCSSLAHETEAESAQHQLDKFIELFPQDSIRLILIDTCIEQLETDLLSIDASKNNKLLTNANVVNLWVEFSLRVLKAADAPDDSVPASLLVLLGFLTKGLNDIERLEFRTPAARVGGSVELAAGSSRGKFPVKTIPFITVSRDEIKAVCKITKERVLNRTHEMLYKMLPLMNPKCTNFGSSKMNQTKLIRSLFARLVCDHFHQNDGWLKVKRWIKEGLKVPSIKI